MVVMTDSLSSRNVVGMVSSVRATVTALRRGELTATSQVEELARRLDGLTPAEHGFSHLDLDAAYSAAMLVDAVPPAHRSRLHGVLMPIKDLSNVAGMPTTSGSARRARLAHHNDVVVDELLAEGVIIPGKSAAAELGLTIYTEPPGLAFPDNPLWPGRTPAGSSGGAAVLVARGILPAAHASDGGGSIRVPAAACGVVGFKPSAPQLAAQGFITRTVDDAAFLHGHPVGVGPRRRIGVLAEPLFAEAEVDDVMLTALASAASALAEAGHEVVAVDPYPQAAETFAAFRTIFTAKLAGLRGPTEGIVAWLRAHGRAVTRAQFAEAVAHAAALPSLLAGTWGVDAIVTPMTTTAAPPPIGYFTDLEPEENFLAQTRWSPWGSLFNMSGRGAISVPWTVAGGPPVGVHLGAVTLDDASLLQLAGELEQ